MLVRNTCTEKAGQEVRTYPHGVKMMPGFIHSVITECGDFISPQGDASAVSAPTMFGDTR